MKDDLLRLFSIPNIIVKVPTIWLLKNCMVDATTLYNAHLMVRYKTVEGIFNGGNYWWTFYKNMQIKRVAQKSIIPRDKANNEVAFRRLVQSMSEKGFDSRYPILINRHFRLIDGSHRLSIALYLKMEYVYVTMNSDTIDMDPEYSLRWFEENGFEEIIEEIKNTYHAIVNEELWDMKDMEEK